MRITQLLLPFVVLAGAAGTAAADDAAGPLQAAQSRTIGIDGGAALPTGSWGDAVGFGIGALGRFEMPVAPRLVLTGRAGLIYHLGKDLSGPAGGMASTQVIEVPLLGGVRYAFSQQPTSAIYGAAELGLVVYHVSTDAGGMSTSGTDTNLGMTLGAGYRTGKLDVRGGLLFPDLGHAGDAIAVMATVGYDLTAL
ncbi:MAG: porin family protein [Deltaproteobacteria bacterium]|nr:MAG: porin family protein [Deltaproteobacteria bacterium]TMQ24365.1 MAG: porin family protein [Deltaproteobacteria bacterium]